MLFPKHRRRPFLLLLLLPLIFSLLYLNHRLANPLSPSPIFTTSRNATSHLLAPRTQHFWSSLHTLLQKTAPSVSEPLRSVRDPTEEDLDASKNDNTSPRPDNIPLTDTDLAALTESHSAYVSALRSLSPQLPVWKGTSGVVMTAGGGYLGTALTSLLLLRRSGSNLPVHLFLDSPAEADPHLCHTVLPKLNAECVLFSSLLRPSDGVQHYQYKVLSILLSPFEKVLYLDSDAWPISSPDRLFTSEPFLSRGLITWPDFWLTTICPHFHTISNSSAPPTLRRRSSESGILLYDKRSHAESLLLATYYNWHGPDVYYPLLSQHAPGEGDKETFAQAALALSQPFYDVRTPDTVLGRWINGTFETAGMKQADPAADFRLQGGFSGADLDADHAREPPAAKKAAPLFIHHNLFKIDLFKVGDASDPMFRLDDEGKPGRLWGPDEKLVRDSGFDVERAMWDVVLKANCGKTTAAANAAGCGNLKRWYEAVFVEAPPLVDGL
ncbi:Alpha-1 2-mannosyltransferase MNN24 [Colletotrichum gloeosporioides]|uniref:Alpha-1 2-mannosyltransferase MNN24 n=1 Tax=Colletotrichum gloeosporioides TaxID=474922 RepID=A0A8H4FIR8_COLGL|nr:Alpha-1 2-mannosyltransferase MNN24 [Colletotrichum gloeosporioides]KAF3803747.1 Alpha-1 2-mannosyltransferase MNN24 [Colletotrichum gloeosporioides]